MTDVRADVGPVDLAVIKFTGNKFTGEVTPALLDLVRAGTVRVLDALFVYRDPEGNIGSLEIGDLGPDMQPAFVEVNGRTGAGLLDPEDVDEVGRGLVPNTSALLLVFENTWAARFAGACRRANGALVDIARIPSQAVADALAAPLGPGRPIGAGDRGRAMGLIRGVARTAVVAGTATAVSNRVSRRQQARWAAQEQATYAQQQAGYAPAEPVGTAPADDLTAQLDRLMELKQHGVLTDEEFAAAKARLLAL